jgi:energy-converting hydrogenase Eha subunit H
MKTQRNIFLFCVVVLSILLAVITDNNIQLKQENKQLKQEKCKMYQKLRER